MVVTIVPLSNLAFNLVRYYSVRFENREYSEFWDFQHRMSLNIRDKRDLVELNRYIERIGNRYGADSKHFKDEEGAERLPPPYHKFIETDDPNNYGLRLYCIRLSPSVVILLNGDRKTALKNKDCLNCYPHFDKARRLAKKLTAAILDGDIILHEEAKELEISEDFDITL